MSEVRESLQAVMDAPGYGKGSAYREQKAQEKEAMALLPDPRFVAPVRASTSTDVGWLLCSMGNSEGDDWFVITDNVSASQLMHTELPSDAKSDAQAVAAIINAYRMGLLVRREEPAP